MARKKKGQLPSGSIRIKVYDYTDEANKKHYQSFTASTRAEAEAKAAEWKANRRQLKTQLCVRDACERYIVSKEAVLSPSTVSSYKGIIRNYLNGILGNQDLKKVSSSDLQIWISELSTRVSPKTVRNAYGLVRSALEMFLPDVRIHVTLPQKKKPELYCPSSEDIRKLLDHAKSQELKIAILLAAIDTMRRGEICALTYGDIQGNHITVNKSMVKDSDGNWIIKQPKTYTSYRTIETPTFLIKMIKATQGEKDSTDRIIQCSPERITGRFLQALSTCTEITHKFRFHDLRHFSASQLHAWGFGDRYIEDRGGWRPGSTVLKQTYENVIDLEKKRASGEMIKKFENAFSR